MDEVEILRILLGELQEKLSLLKDLVQRDSQFPEAPKTMQRALEAGMKELKIDGEIITLDSYSQKGIIVF